MLRPYYREFELPWSLDEDQEGVFRKLWSRLLIATVVVGLLLSFISLPERVGPVESSVPPRLAKILVEKEPPPPPPPPKVEPEKPEQVPEKTAAVKPKEPEPQNQMARTQKAREKAQQAGLLAFQDDLADLRQQVELTKDQLQQTANTTGTVDGPSRAERSVITSKVGQASAGIGMSGQSRGFGSGAGNLGGKGTTQMVVPFGGSGSGTGLSGSADDVKRTGAGGKASRSREEIELVFDRNKGAIYALYSRALRDQPDLQGKMVLEFTIAPSGEVTMCRVVSSEVNDPELERKIVQRVRLFRFEARDVEAITTTKPIDFFPA